MYSKRKVPFGKKKTFYLYTKVILSSNLEFFGNDARALCKPQGCENIKKRKNLNSQKL